MFSFLQSRGYAGYNSTLSRLSNVRPQQSFPAQKKSVGAKKRIQVPSAVVSTMKEEETNHGSDARLRAYENGSANLKRPRVRATRLSNTNLCLFMDFGQDNLMFLFIMA